MNRPKQRFANHLMMRLALGPVSLVLALGGVAAAAPAGQDLRQAEQVFRKVIDAETKLAKALTARDGRAIAAVADGLGPIIDSAMARQKAGQKASSCELAAHSLAFLAVSAAGSLTYTGEAKRLLLGDARTAASNFKTDVIACEGYIGQKSGNHTSVEKALRAL